MSSDILKAKAILETNLQQIEAQILEIKRRLPAHSVKPVMMRELLELEDERDDTLRQLQALNHQPS